MRFQDKIAIGLQAIGATPSAAYSAAKAGRHALTKNLASELAPYKKRVNAIAPRCHRDAGVQYLPDPRGSCGLARIGAVEFGL